MFVVVDRPKLVRMLDLARDDKKRGPKVSAEETPYLRIAALPDGQLRLSGLHVEAAFPASVHEPGVLFIRAARFRQVLATMRGEKMLSIQASAEELAFGDVHIPMIGGDILLYPDPASAPEFHPGDRQRAETATKKEIAAARRRVEAARKKVLLAAESMVYAENELAELVGGSFDARKVLTKLMDDVVQQRPDKTRRARSAE